MLSSNLNSIKTYIVDSFTNELFKGNPAGVCFIDHILSNEKMLKIAQEFGLSETAFVQSTSKTGVYNIRYFSPKKEIPLCGHATLASAKILFTTKNESEIHFITSENLDLIVRRSNNEISMEFPVYDTVALAVPTAVLEALGILAIINSAYSPKNKIILLEISNDQVLAGLTPNFSKLLKSYKNINGILVTAPSSNKEFDFHYRYFWPWAGTDEDPVTGGVQTFLTKYWAKKLGKKKMKAFQSSSRTGYMSVELKKDKVVIFGQAIIVFEGNLLCL